MFILNQENSLANHFLRELRDEGIQKDSMRFRKNLKRLGQIMAYEISKKMQYQNVQVATPLGALAVPLLQEQPVLISILRAAMPFYDGFLDFFDQAESGFVGAYRSSRDDEYQFDIAMEYIATVDIQDKVVIIIDPMLATGKSLIKAVQGLLKYGKPSYIHIVSVIATPEGFRNVQDIFKDQCDIWTVALDNELNKKAYIIPGLGDAGDLSFGIKI